MVKCGHISEACTVMISVHRGSQAVGRAVVGLCELNKYTKAFSLSILNN